MKNNKKKIYIFNGYNLINNTKFFFYENDFNDHKNENDLNLEIYVKKYQNEWLNALDDWHKKVYLKNFKISWRWSLTKAAKLEYIYPHHLKPLLAAAAVINYIEINDENISLYNFTKESIDYIEESFDKNRYELVNNELSEKKIKKIDLSFINKFFLHFLKVISIPIRKLLYFSKSQKVRKSPDLLILSNTIDLKTLNEKGDHFFGRSFDTDKYDINWFYIVDNLNEIVVIKDKFKKIKNRTLHYEFVKYSDVIKIIFLLFHDVFNIKKYKNNITPVSLGYLNSKKFYENFLSSSLNDSLIYETMLYFSLKNYIKQTKPKKIIYPYERKGFESALLKICKSFSEIETIGFAHAYYSNRHRYLNYFEDKNYFYPSKIALTGKSSFNFFIKKNWPIERCFILGSPRNFKIINSNPQLTVKKIQKILVIVGYHYELKVLVNWLIKNAENLKKYQFIIRPYPHDWHALQLSYIKKLNGYPINFSIMNNVSIYEQFIMSDVVLFNESSAGIEAMFSNSIVIRFLADELIQLYDTAQKESESIRSVQSSDELIERLNIIGLYSSEELTSELEQQNSQAENIYAKIDITKIC